MFHVGFNSFDEESLCFMWVLTFFGCPELQRVVFHVGFNSCVPKSLCHMWVLTLFCFQTSNEPYMLRVSKNVLEFFWVSEGAGLLVSVCKFRTNAGICVERYQSV